MGISSSVRSETEASLQQYFKGIQGAARVTSSDIGSIADKITPGESGNELYKAYSECLKIQMALALSRHGVNVQGVASTEKDKRQHALNAIASIGPDTPSARLIEIFGQADRDYIPQDQGGEHFKFVSYSYEGEVSAIEIFDKAQRIAVALVWHTNKLDDAEQLRSNETDRPFMSLGKAMGSCHGKSTGSTHLLVRSGLCGGSHADDYQYKVFLFAPSAYGFLDDANHCSKFVFGEEQTFDVSMCPKLAHGPPFAVVMGRDDVVLERAGEAFFDFVVFN